MSDLEALRAQIEKALRNEIGSWEDGEERDVPASAILASAVFPVVERFVSSLPQDPDQKYAAMENRIRALADVLDERADDLGGSCAELCVDTANEIRALLETP